MDDATREAIATTGRILGALFLSDPADDEARPLFDGLGQLASPEEWPFGSISGLEAALQRIDEGLQAPRHSLAREYQRLFIGPQHFEAPAWGSVYLDKDQVLFGASLLELRRWMRESGITVNDDKREPEDHIGKMLLLLGWLADEKPALIEEFLAQHLMPWAPRYLELLLTDAREPFYQGLAMLAGTTLEGMAEELGVTAVKKKLFR